MELDITVSLRALSRALSETSANWYLTGGLVSSFYGEPRFTQDIDIVVCLERTPASNKELISCLKKEFIVDEVSASKLLAQKQMFQALHEETLFKIDIYPFEAIQGALQRSISIEVFPGLLVKIPSRTDAILSKLLWLQKGSEKSRRDLWFMLEGASIEERDSVARQAKDMGTFDLFNEIVSNPLTS